MSKPTNAPPTLEGADYIRPFADGDRDTVEQLVGQGFMEGLRTANNRVYMKPKTIAFALILGEAINLLSLRIQGADLFSWFTYLQIVLTPCLIFIPILGIVEYIQRPSFDERMRTAVRGEDIRSPAEYYTAPGGCWVFELKDKVIGVVTLDVHSPGKEVAPGKPISMKHTTHPREAPEVISEAEKVRRVEEGKVSQLAELRHVDVDHLYRQRGVGTELVAHALDTAFGVGKPGSTGVKRVIARTSPFTKGGDALWRRTGFSPVMKGARWRSDEGLGLDEWRGVWVAIDRVEWLVARAGLYDKYEHEDKEGKKDQ